MMESRNGIPSVKICPIRFIRGQKKPNPRAGRPWIPLVKICVEQNRDPNYIEVHSVIGGVLVSTECLKHWLHVEVDRLASLKSRSKHNKCRL